MANLYQVEKNNFTDADIVSLIKINCNNIMSAFGT